MFVTAHGIMAPVNVPDCLRCHGEGWVCEEHELKPWHHTLTDGQPCGAPGAPCDEPGCPNRWGGLGDEPNDSRAAEPVPTS
jgi:hypothetical protein